MYRDEFLTCGYDGYVIMWDAVAHIDLWAVHLNGQVNKIKVRICPKQKYLPPRKKNLNEKINNAMIFILYSFSAVQLKELFSMEIAIPQ